MAENTVLADLQTTLTDVLSFLQAHRGDISTAFKALSSLFPQVNALIDSLIKILNEIKTEIDKLDISKIQGVEQITGFTQKISAMLSAFATLLKGNPVETEINSVLDTVKTVGEIPQFAGQIKDTITKTIQQIIDQLNLIKAGS